MTALPFFKFYPGDHVGAPGWAIAHNEALGVYLRLLLYMWQGTPRGYLTIGSYDPDETELAAMVGSDKAAIATLLATLLRANLVSRDDHGRLYCPWLVAQAADLQSAHQRMADSGQLGAIKRWKKNVTAASTSVQPAMPAHGPSVLGGHSQANGVPIAIRSQKAEEREDTPMSPVGTPCAPMATLVPIKTAAAMPQARRRMKRPRVVDLPPTVEEIATYIAARSSPINAAEFHAKYTANGWRLGSGMDMVDWRATIITWENMRSPGGRFDDSRGGGHVPAKAATEGAAQHGLRHPPAHNPYLETPSNE